MFCKCTRQDGRSFELIIDSWNSSVVSTTGTDCFSYVVAFPGFLADNAHPVDLPINLNNETNEDFSCQTTYPASQSPDVLKETIGMIRKGYLNNTYEHLNPALCLHQYSNQLFSRRNLIVVLAHEANSTASQCGYDRKVWQYGSVLGIDLDVFPSESQLSPNMATGMNERRYDWSIEGVPVSQCWSEIREVQNCELQFESAILIITVICTAIELVCLTLRVIYV